MSDKDPAVTVIVPAYNEEENIGRCLQSLKDQKFSRPYKIIVINGPSQDDTASICADYGVKTINLDKRGINLAWQKGADTATSDILAFTEADCVVPENWLETIYGQFQDQKDLVGLTGEYRVMGARNWNRLISITMPLVDGVYKSWTGIWPFRGTNFALRKKYLNECGGFNLDMLMYGDVELSSRIGKLGKINYLKDFLVYTSNRNYCSIKRVIKFVIRGLNAVFAIAVLKDPSKMNYIHS